MEQIEDLQKRLSRPIKDLDDVRQAMASLKELRENEIEIDTSLCPVEVCTCSYSNDNHLIRCTAHLSINHQSIIAEDPTSLAT